MKNEDSDLINNTQIYCLILTQSITTTEPKKEKGGKKTGLKRRLRSKPILKVPKIPLNFLIQTFILYLFKRYILYFI